MKRPRSPRTSCGFASARRQRDRCRSRCPHGGYNPQYSPRGRFIVFHLHPVGKPAGLGLRRRRRESPPGHRLEHACIWNPCWSYDERRIAFSAAQDNVAGIYIADAETGRVQCLSESDRHWVVLGWSRDGRGLYCKADVEGRWWVRRMALDGSGTIDILEKDVFRLAESIDGRRLIYSRSDTSCVWSVSVDGTDGRRVWLISRRW